MFTWTEELRKLERKCEILFCILYTTGDPETQFFLDINSSHSNKTQTVPINSAQWHRVHPESGVDISFYSLGWIFLSMAGVNIPFDYQGWIFPSTVRAENWNWIFCLAVNVEYQQPGIFLSTVNKIGVSLWVLLFPGCERSEHIKTHQLGSVETLS